MLGKHFELVDPFGNARLVFSTKNNLVDLVKGEAIRLNHYFTVDVVSYSDYYPYGMLMPNRHGQATTSFEYGFNGMRMDDEIKNQKGTSYDFGGRMYDARVGRWLKMDNVSQPERSPYSGMHNNPILLSDPDGNDVIIGTFKKEDRDKFVAHLVGITGIELFIKGWGELKGSPKSRSELTRDLAGTTGMKFFHELSHGMDGTKDEWDMGTPSPNASRFGDSRSASGVLSGSATSFENTILSEMGLFNRATYSIKFGGQKIVPYIRPSRDINLLLNRFKSAGSNAKFPATVDYTIIPKNPKAPDDEDRDFKTNPTSSSSPE